MAPELTDVLTALRAAEQTAGEPVEFLLVHAGGMSREILADGWTDDTLTPTHTQVDDLAEGGYLRIYPTGSDGMDRKFALTEKGRAAGKEIAASDPSSPAQEHPPPGLDDVLRWLGELQKTAKGAALLASGAGIANQAVAEFGSDHIEVVAGHLVALKEEGLIDFVDPLARLDGLPLSDRLGGASEFRLRTLGIDRIAAAGRANPQVIQQVIHAAQAQVAAGDIHNYASYDDLLVALGAKIDAIQGVDEETKNEARGLLGKLGSASGQAATGAVASAGGALLGGLLKQLLNLPDS